MGLQTLLDKLVPVLFEDDRLVAVAKPAGIDAGGAGGPAKSGLVETLAGLRGSGETLLPINRLSRFESGVLLLGKDREIVQTLRSALRTGQVSQSYVAVIRGRLPQPRMTIDGSSKTPARPDRRPGKKKPVKKRGTAPAPGNPSSNTLLEVIQPHERVTLIRCATHTHSTHALRATLRSVGARLQGDSLHNLSNRPEEPRKTRLHLERLTFRHPDNRKRVNLTARLPDGFGDPQSQTHDIERALHAAMTRRLTCFAARDTNAYRLLTGDAEGLKGIVAERYGPVVVLQVLQRDSLRADTLRMIARWYRNVLGVEAVYAKHFVKDRTASDESLAESHREPKPLVGKSVEPEIQIVERGIKYAIRPYDGFSVGLFLDHRENRRRVSKMSQGKDVLNLFAYTCGFSVAAAKGGARHTVSVDLSRKHLDWGSANFELNGLDPTEHDFVVSDASLFLRGAKRRDRQFGLIVLDPPTFAHGRKRGHRFSIQQDLADLIAASVAVLEPGGVLMVATSYRQASHRWLTEQIGHAVGPRRCKILEKPSLPPDFAVDPDHAKTLFARVF